MSSVSMAGACSAAMFSSLQQSRAADSGKAQQLFSKLDVNGDNTIDKSELKSFVDYVGEKTGATGIDADSLLTTLDSDGDGSITATELTDNSSKLFDQLRGQLMSAQMSSRPQPPDPTQMFDSIDSDGDGSISKTELDSFLAERADGTGDGPSATDILARDDADGDGSISADEFKTAMQRGPGGAGGPGGPPPPPPSSSSSDDDPLSTLLALLQQYGSVSGSDSSSTSTSTLSVAA